MVKPARLSMARHVRRIGQGNHRSLMQLLQRRDDPRSQVSVQADVGLCE